MTKRHVFNFNPTDNGGESLLLVTTYEPNGDTDEDGYPTLISSQELTLQSYCNSASFNLSGAALTPDNLRQLANELDAFKARAKVFFEEAEL